MKRHARTTKEGRQLGSQLARLAETEIALLAINGETDDRCKTCAFRIGTVPNGCPQTALDAIKAVMENVPFMCHHKQPPNAHICHGWYAARRAIKDKRTLECPWEFSAPDENG